MAKRENRPLKDEVEPAHQRQKVTLGEGSSDFCIPNRLGYGSKISRFTEKNLMLRQILTNFHIPVKNSSYSNSRTCIYKVYFF